MLFSTCKEYAIAFCWSQLQSSHSGRKGINSHFETGPSTRILVLPHAGGTWQTWRRKIFNGFHKVCDLGAQKFRFDAPIYLLVGMALISQVCFIPILIGYSRPFNGHRSFQVLHSQNWYSRWGWRSHFKVAAGSFPSWELGWELSFRW